MKAGDTVIFLDGPDQLWAKVEAVHSDGTVKLEGHNVLRYDHDLTVVVTDPAFGPEVPQETIDQANRIRRELLLTCAEDIGVTVSGTPDQLLLLVESISDFYAMTDTALIEHYKDGEKHGG